MQLSAAARCSMFDHDAYDCDYDEQAKQPTIAQVTSSNHKLLVTITHKLLEDHHLKGDSNHDDHFISTNKSFC